MDNISEKTKDQLIVKDSLKEKKYNYYSLVKLKDVLNKEYSKDLDLSKTPFSVKILMESLIRNYNGKEITGTDILNLADWSPNGELKEIPFMPARVILQDFTGVPALVDLASMRDAMQKLGGSPEKINPQIPVALVVDHSVQIDFFASPEALQKNIEKEFERNSERYEFIKWGQKSLKNFDVVPPGNGIIHQVNLEYLAGGVLQSETEKETIVYPDSLVGTDSHTTMINGLGVLGWGVGGIEAEAAMLGQPLSMLTPEVIGFKITGELPKGSTATDIALYVTQILREKNVVGKFVEFYGRGLSNMSLADRATIANMAPEYGATMGFFPMDVETLRYMKNTGRNDEQILLVEEYTKAQGLFRDDNTPDPEFSDYVELNLSNVRPSLAGPKRPQDRIDLYDIKNRFEDSLNRSIKERGFGLEKEAQEVTVPFDENHQMTHGSVVIASITSCTNTSNPSVLIAAGLLAKKAVSLGLKVPSYVKTSLAPGSRVVEHYLKEAGLMDSLETLGFHIVGYGCTTCIGNSGPLPEPVVEAIQKGDLIAASVLSGNRNFEGRINPHVKANFLASPPLVVAFALAGNVNKDFAKEPIGVDPQGNEVYLKDIWPNEKEINDIISLAEKPGSYKSIYERMTGQNELWNAIPVTESVSYSWNKDSTYIQNPPFFEGLSLESDPIRPIENARVLLKLADSVTTDHISPAGSFKADTPAGKYLVEKGVVPGNFNSYGSRRGNDRVMTRGTFANIRLKNELAPGTEGGWTILFGEGNLKGSLISVFDASREYIEQKIPTIVLAGKDYGMGSSRDWAAKGTLLLGIKAVIAESFERIHRSNLVGMGVLPLQFEKGDSHSSLGLTGKEIFQVPVHNDIKPGEKIEITVKDPESRAEKKFIVTVRIDTPVEVEYYRNGGILHTVLKRLASE